VVGADDPGDRRWLNGACRGSAVALSPSGVLMRPRSLRFAHSHCKFVQIKPNKKAFISLYFLGFLWWNRDFSKGYDESKQFFSRTPRRRSAMRRSLGYPRCSGSRAAAVDALVHLRAILLAMPNFQKLLSKNLETPSH
jgi:hypothetical protein